MVELQITIADKQKPSAPTRKRSTFALGWIHFQSSSSASMDGMEDQMRVLGLMVVQDQDLPEKDAES